MPPDMAGEAIDLPVVYEDDDLLVVDKPAGLVDPPGARAMPPARSSTPSWAGPARRTGASPASPGRASSIASTATRAAC